jgi:hypothetical protein
MNSVLALVLCCLIAEIASAQQTTLPLLYRASASATVTIGAGTNPAVVLDQIMHVARNRQGELLVSTYKDKHIHRFDASGRALGSLGRSGGGPGEFLAAPQFTLMSGDSVAAVSAGRLSIFSPQGDFVRSAQIRAPDRVRGTLLGAGDAGHVLFSDAARDSRGGLRARDSIEVWRVHATSGQMTRAFIAPRGAIPPPAAAVRRRSGSVRVSTRITPPSRPFAAQHIVAGQDRVAIVEDSTWTIVLRDFAGRPLGRINTPRTNARRGPRESPNDSFRGWQMLFDSENRLWVQEALPSGGDLSRWTIYDATGVAIGYAMLPGHIHVNAITPELIVGTARDEDDVQSVVVHTLLRPR